MIHAHLYCGQAGFLWEGVRQANLQLNGLPCQKYRSFSDNPNPIVQQKFQVTI